jgi:hypothetical protein
MDFGVAGGVGWFDVAVVIADSEMLRLGEWVNSDVMTQLWRPQEVEKHACA